MRSKLKKILFKFYKPYASYVISANREYAYKGLNITVPKGIFHPGMFFSTTFLADQLNKLTLTNKTFLELGCGSGLISLMAARLGANVTAIDINPLAVSTAKLNALNNNLTITAVVSDLFVAIKDQKFDYIFINPPYYKKNPASHQAAAWYAGDEYQYFEKLFSTVGNHIHGNSVVKMIVSEDVDIPLLEAIAQKNSLQLERNIEKLIMLELNFIYLVKPL